MTKTLLASIKPKGGGAIALPHARTSNANQVEVKADIIKLMNKPLLGVHEQLKLPYAHGKPPRRYVVTHIPTGARIAKYKQKAPAVSDCKEIIAFCEGYDCSAFFATDPRILANTPFYSLARWLTHRGGATIWGGVSKSFAGVELALAASHLQDLKDSLAKKQ